MKPHTKKKPLNIIFKKSRSSLLIMSALCTAYSGITYSQETDNKDAKETDETEVIEVKGMRSNISAAQHLKRHANTVIDSITAEDIGDFPDKSVAEALQRVPGITVERFGSRTDTKAFSVEPSGVLVRGLGFVRSEFNGRDSFSANSSRGLSWGDVSPELMGGVDVYKSQTAELIEGGIAGLINLKTRLPFDSENDYKVLTVRGNYSDLSESTTPEISGIYTTRMNTDVGEFGFMANMAYSKVDATAQTSRVSRMIKYRGVYGDNEDELHYIPDNFNASDDLYSRTRLGASLAAQWQSNEADKLVTLQYNRSEKDQDRAQSGISAGLGNPFFQKSLLLEATPTGDGSDKIPAAADGTDPFTFDERGFFQTGRLVAPSTWRGKDNAASALRAMNSEGQALLNNCAGAWAGCDPVDYTGTGMTTNGGFSTRNNITEDYGLNFKWHLTDEIHTNFDLQYVESTEDWYSLTTTLSSYTDPDVDLTGDEIKLVFHEPTNVNLLDSGQGIYANPNSYRLDNIMDMYGDSEGTELAARADIVFDVYNEVVERVKFGVRYADREQQVNNGFNWASVVNTWSDNTAPFYNLDSAPTTGEFNGNPYTFNGFPQSWEIKEWESTYGDFTTADGMNLFVVPDPVAMQNWRNTMGASTIGAPTSAWEPICSGLGNRSIEVDGGCFTPVEMIDISEESKAAYVQIDFGGDDFTLFGKQLSGNLGIRYVETEVYSSGGEAYPSMDDTLLICKDREESEDPEAPPQEITKSLGCYLKAEDIAFSNNGNIAGEASTSYSHVLPSLNLKMDLTDNFLTRIALSKAISRPDIGILRNYINVQQRIPSTDNPQDPAWERDANGDIVGANVTYFAKASNPTLKPITAKQVDLSFEYYSKATSVSLALFHKRFDDYIQSGIYERELTNNGVTKTVSVSGAVNGEGAKFSGFEIQGTKWFDFLPAPFNGLGIQANYTYINNNGVANTNVSSGAADGSGNLNTGQSPDVLEVAQLEGLSDTAYNMILMYQKGSFQGKIAYNWREEFLVTNSDCCIAYPVWQDDYGQIDASARYKINETFEVNFSIQNLTGEEAVLTQQVENSSDGGLRLPYSTNQSDTRYTFTLTTKF